MGESSACLMRSLSQPSPTSSDEKQRDPLQRALSSSISFGRFMSESLDWEKWSAFTHNRYLEEVEKYKRPGSVAEKKAYFEARYKRRKAEALLEQDNEACTDLPQLNETNENQDNSSSDSESAQKNGNVVTGITKKDDVQNSEVTVLEGISEDAESSVKKSSNKLEIERDIGNIMPNKADNTQEKGATMGDSALSGKKKPAFSPAKLSTTKNSDLSTPNCKKTVRNSTNKMRSTPRSLHRSINFDAHPREAIKASSPGPKKIVNSRLIPTLSNKSKDSNVAPTSTRASMNSMVKLPAVTPRPENKSYSRPSSTRESKAQTSTVPSSFIFKSEERAAKRKEEKPKIDFRDMRHSIAFKVGPNGKTSAKTESPNNLVKKIPKIQTCEEEFKEKAASKVQDKDSRPAWRFSAKTDGSKDVAGKSSRPPIYSAKSLPKKRQHENVSPNIQP
ncbi:protein WVD2-like 7 isoform X3 [Olea europaea var. sylvestris]|uniref:protein WVD2-like 7 isoform X3 n=1 Tax=Olea europaea var. sylvestris TaxID=158386 RepID=UPI000C1D2032|nr:protein WVD2-like 7 isoform X3 [Olea europaea var. sylvestris]